MLKEEIRVAVSELAATLADKKNEESKLLSSLARDAKISSDNAIKNKASKFAMLAESNFLEGKRLSSLAALEKDASAYDYKAMGTTEEFPCTLSFDDGVWEFLLPPTPSIKNGKRGNAAGRYIGYLVKNLMANYATDYEKLPRLSEPVIVFEYGFGKDDVFSELYDADNRDNKRILDAMTGIFYPDDNILSIKTIHYGTVADKDYTKVFVMEKPRLESFLKENSHW